MESKSPGLTASEAASALTAAEASRATLADGLVLPSWFFSSIGCAVGVQIGTSAAGIGAGELWLLAAGVALFAVVAAAQLLRFRRRNGAWLGGLASRVVLGTATGASVSYAASFAAAIWGAFGAHWWLVAACSLIGGTAYALSGRHWMRSYRADPSGQSRGEAPLQLVALGLVALAGLATLLLNA